MHSNLGCHHLKIDYIYVLYNPLGKQKGKIFNRHKKRKRKESKHSTLEHNQITREENKRTKIKEQQNSQKVVF